jgi:hypothetical protein
MVFLPKDVEGLALIEPESNKHLRIVAREKTPYFSKAKKDDSNQSDEESQQRRASMVAIPNFMSLRKPFSTSSEINQGRQGQGQPSTMNYDIRLRKTKEPTDLLNQINGFTTGRKLRKQVVDDEPSGPNQRFLSENKPKVPRFGEINASAVHKTHLKGSQGLNLASARGNKFIEQNHVEVPSRSMVKPYMLREDPISVENPESIASHVRAIRDPDPENPDKKFTQLFMDDGFKKVYGTKLAVTPNKVFGSFDKAGVKRGTS